MTPQDYIKKHCIISSRRQTLYQKIFLKNKDKSQAIVFKVSERQSTVKPDCFYLPSKESFGGFRNHPVCLSVQASIWSLWTFILHENCCLAHNRVRVVVDSCNLYQTNSFLPVYAVSEYLYQLLCLVSPTLP